MYGAYGALMVWPLHLSCYGRYELEYVALGKMTAYRQGVAKEKVADIYWQLKVVFDYNEF